MTPLMIGISVSLYQAFTSDETHCEVIIKDADTAEQMSSVIYPDALEDSNNSDGEPEQL